MAKHLQNVEQVFVGAAANITTSALNSTFVNNTGEIGIFTPDGRRLVQGSGANGALNAANTQFVIAQARGASAVPKVLVSGVIDKAKVVKATRLVYTAATEQVDYIGYNGTSGSIEVNPNELYYIQIYLEDYITSSHDGRYIKHGQYNSNSSSTEPLIAAGLVNSLINNFSREAKPLMRFGLTASGARTIVPTGAGTLTFVSGSKYVTFSTDIADATGAAALAVGDYLTVAAATTNHVYKVTAIDTATDVATIDIPFQGDTVTVANATAKFIVAATANAGTFGIKMEGLAQTWVLEKKFFKKIRWNTNLSEDAFGATVLTHATAASEGSGEGEQVAEMERFYNRSFGEEYRIGEPNIYSFRQDTVVATNYDLINLVYTQDEVGGGFVANVSPKVIAIALPETAPNYAVTGTADDITDVLEELVFGSATGDLNVT